MLVKQLSNVRERNCEFHLSRKTHPEFLLLALPSVLHRSTLLFSDSAVSHNHDFALEYNRRITYLHALHYQQFRN